MFRLLKVQLGGGARRFVIHVSKLFFTCASRP